MKKQFDLKEPHRFVMYARMSTNQQNERSPDQQFEMIEKQVKQLGFPWTCVGRYRDDGVSGKLVRKRPDFLRMYNDIVSSRLDVELILVDTLDRFSRSSEGWAILFKLFNEFRVLVLSASNQFADPTTEAGELLQFVDGFRSRQENAVKAHQVSRGKHDTVRQGFWPGGTPPFGYKLEYIQSNAARGPRSHRAKLVVDPQKATVVRLAYELAVNHGWGENRVYRALREDQSLSPDVRQKLTLSGVGRMLKNEIYLGRITFGRLDVETINDRKVIHRNNEDELTTVEDYCDPIIDTETFAKVQQLRELRPQTSAGRAKGKEKTTRRRLCRGGTALKYPLSGLVVCGVCGNTMKVNSSQTYLDAQGKRRTYPRYTCPLAYQGRCSNRSSIKETWLRDEVATHLQRFLFGEMKNLDQGPSDRREPVWMAEFRQEVESAYRAIVEDSIDDRDSLIEERKQLKEQKDGILKSLSDSKISESLRIALQDNFDNHDQRIADIDRMLQRPQKADEDLRSLFDYDEIWKRLDQLSSLLLDVNPTAANVELSLVIDKIICNPGNEVIIRFCKLGLFPLNSNVELAFRDVSTPKVSSGRTRLACRDVDDGDKAYFAADKTRFDGLPNEWFFEVPLAQPRELCWSEKHALEVAQYRKEHRASNKELAAHFEVSEATIIKTLKIARDQHGIDMTGNAVGRRHGKYKAKDLVPHALDYLEANQCSQKAAAAHFEVSPPTFNKALELCRAARQAEDADERQIA